VEVLRASADDPRFAGKGIGLRSVLVVGAFSLAIPVLWALRGRKRPYPIWMDDLYLSVFALDLGGNVLDLYDTYRHFDLIPHAHGTGAVTVLAAWLFGLPVLGATVAGTIGHILLETQEYIGDLYFGTRNVRGAWDVFGDLVAGAVGSLVYSVVYLRLVRHAGREPPSPLASR
jgi:hypothetical protein